MRRISSVGLGRWMRPGSGISRRPARLRTGIAPVAMSLGIVLSPVATLLGIVLSITGWLLLATPAGAQDDAPKLVSHGAQGYSIDANATPIAQVLTEVGQQAGFTIEAPDTYNSQITVNMQDVPLDQLLRRVLRDENYIIVYRGGVQKTSVSGDKIDKIFLLTQAPAAGGPRPPGGGSPLAGPGSGPGAGHAPGPPGGRGAPPPPPPMPAGDEEGGDVATRAARARARADARRAALGDQASPAAGAAMANPAQMVPHPEDFTPPPIDEPASPHTGDVPAVDVPPEDAEE